ncbi:MAG: energy transducer TonB [Bdellovibrionales bacterium]|nr:energy transducer TonB [Bdellovibrionales bacterium]
MSSHTPISATSARTGGSSDERSGPKLTAFLALSAGIHVAVVLLAARMLPVRFSPIPPSELVVIVTSKAGSATPRSGLIIPQKRTAAREQSVDQPVVRREVTSRGAISKTLPHAVHATPPSPAALHRSPSGEDLSRMASSAPLARYEQQVAAIIEANKYYPARARQLGIRGAGQIRIVIERSGRLRERDLMQSTGSRTLDRAIARIIDRAAPFPAFPEGLEETEMALIVPIHFSLEG